MKIMIAEDDRSLNNGIAMSFSEDEIIQAYCLSDAEKFYRETRASICAPAYDPANSDDQVKPKNLKNLSNTCSPIDLIILDVNMPDGSGLDFCRRIRENDDIPIIFLTANDMEIDIVNGLESGGDDYITKPFSLAILRARVNAVMRRKRAFEDSAGADDVFESGVYRFDFENMMFFSGGQQVELSKTEQRLLKVLVRNPGRVLERRMLMERVWTDGPEFVDENALSVTVRRLRKKLGNIPLRTVYGIGYIWGEKI